MTARKRAKRAPRGRYYIVRKVAPMSGWEEPSPCTVMKDTDGHPETDQGYPRHFATKKAALQYIAEHP